MPPSRQANGLPWPAGGVEELHVPLRKLEFSAHGESALSLVAGKGEELLHARRGEIDLFIETNFLELTRAELLAQLPFIGLAFASEFQNLATGHEADGADVWFFIDLDAVAEVAARLAAFTAADFKVFDFVVGGVWFVRFIHLRVRGGLSSAAYNIKRAHFRVQEKI